jgi:hypothetical protein
MSLRNRLTSTHMSDTNTMASYLMKITELRDRLFFIEEKIVNEELVSIA